MGRGKVDKPQWHDKIPKKLLREWDEILARDGFKDIEAGVGREGHMLKGPTPSFRLIASTGQALRPFDDVADSEAEVFDYQQGDKAEYYRAAERLCVTEAHRIRPYTLYCWCLHSQGWGERKIAEALDIQRVNVRDHLILLKSEITRLTTTPTVG